MRVSKTWNQFKLMLDIAHPKRGDTLQLPLMADFATDPIEHKKAGTPAAQPSLFDPTSDEEEWSPLLEAARKLAWKDEDDGK
jgi:hypothetical protein